MSMHTVTDARGVIHTGSLGTLARQFGSTYNVVYARWHGLKWSLEEALGIVARPVACYPRSNSRRRQLPELPICPRLGSAQENLWAAMTGLIDAEEYLQREGMGSNGYVLRSPESHDEH